jgi:hypothetical protein
VCSAVTLLYHASPEEEILKLSGKNPSKVKKFFGSGVGGSVSVGTASKKTKKVADIELLRCLGTSVCLIVSVYLSMVLYTVYCTLNGTTLCACV